MFILFQLQFSEVSEVDGGPFQWVESDHTTFWKNRKGKINQVSLAAKYCAQHTRAIRLNNWIFLFNRKRAIKIPKKNVSIAAMLSLPCKNI